MKLWQKIFFPTLVLVMLSGFIISINMILRNHTIQTEVARDDSIALSENITQHIIDATNEYKHSFFLSSGILDAMIDNVCSAASSDGVTVSYQCLNEDRANNSGRSVSFLEDSHEIQVQTNVFVSGSIYQITVRNSIASLLPQFRSDIYAAQVNTSIIAVSIATLLLLLTVFTTRPIRDLGIATEKIAAGDYRYRVNYKGQDELSVLAQQMNKMAAKIDQDTSYIEKISESRKQFIDSMTHELKTPLTSILGFADILRTKPDITDDERREYADVILTEAKRLRALSTRLMELITANGANLSKGQVDLEKLIDNRATAYQPICEENQISLRLALEHVVLMADEALLSTLILNLIDNARKASSAGDEIFISCKRDKDRAMIRVIDHGTGIPKEDLPYVTDAFYMVDKARTRKAGGAGIGLSLCQAIVNAHKGQFFIESELGRGTTVTVLFPIFEERDT